MTIGGGVVTALAVATGVYLFGSSETATNQSAAPSSSTSSDATASASDAGSTSSTNTVSSTTASATASYKDGTYSANTSYYVPHGTNNLTAKITVQNGKITAVTVNNDYSDNESGMYIDSFEAAIKNAVVGQDIGSLSLSRIGGATLTTQAFDDALATIRNDAKA